MSRTDKTNPYWVRAVWWKPVHVGCAMGNWKSRRQPCDLPDAPVLAHPSRPRAGRWSCHWVPQWPWNYRLGYSTRHVRGWFIDHRWNNPERVRVRDECLDMVKEFRGSGSVEHEFLSWNHRHGARWDWD